MAMGIWILNGKSVDGGSRLKDRHVLIEGARVARIADVRPAAEELEGHEVIDVRGRLIAPGFIDMHVHLREPGFEHKETIATGTRAAARGGFTTVACMPNTRPVIDNAETLSRVYETAAREGSVRVLSYAAITVGQLGRELADFAALKAAGAIGFTDDGVGVQSAGVMRDAMALAASLDLPIVAHCEDMSLIAEGAAVTDGAFARKHGLKGIPNESESVHVARDVLLAEATGAHYHVCHVSTEQSVRLIRMAKRAGVRVTAEVCPHHLLLSDEDIPGPDPNWKMNPPLRSPRDVQAVLEGLEDGTIDIIVTDHAPHSAEEKARGLKRAPFGIIGLETAFPLLYTRFVAAGRWTLEFLLSRLTEKPAEVFRLPGGTIREGGPADLTVIDLEREKPVREEEIVSKSKNTPFLGWTLKGWPVLTIAAGKTVWNEL